MKLEDLKDYKLVWSDEFDGDCLDPEKWCFHNIMGRCTVDGKLRYDFSEEEKNVRVEDSLLKLNVYYDAERDCYIGPSAPTTYNTMSFTYGYIEMRARVPYTHASWSSFWACGRDAIKEDKSIPYFIEIDFFEIEGANHVAIPNLHKWHYGWSEWRAKGKTGNDNITSQLGLSINTENSRIGHIRPDDMEGFNTYGFLWTPEKIEMYLNGQIYGRFDITQNLGRESGMEGFHHPVFFLMNHYLMIEGAPDTIGSNSKTASVTPESVAAQVPYEIDYIRLYQKPGEGELNIGR